LAVIELCIARTGEPALDNGQFEAVLAHPAEPVGMEMVLPMNGLTATRGTTEPGEMIPVSSGL